MKLYNIVNPEFGKAFNKLMNAKVSGKVAFKLTKLAKDIKENADIYDKLRIAACEEFAKKDEEGKPVMVENAYDIPDEDMPKLNAKIQDLLNVDVGTNYLFTMEDFENAELTANEMLVIAELIQE